MRRPARPRRHPPGRPTTPTRTAAGCASPPTIQTLDVVRVRPFDVATFVAFGAAQLGICGADVLMEFDYPEIYAPLDLGIGRCRVSVAEPAETAGSDDPARWSRVRVATKYPNIARRHFAARGIQADVVHLNGAMELAPGLGLARLIVDLVQTGSHAEGQRPGRDRGDRPRHQPADRQPHRAEDPARGDRRLDRPLPRRAGQGMRCTAFHRRSPDFEARFTALLAQARETTARVDQAVAAIIARSAPAATPP